jgi:hypothetical protein
MALAAAGGGDFGDACGDAVFAAESHVDAHVQKKIVSRLELATLRTVGIQNVRSE